MLFSKTTPAVHENLLKRFGKEAKQPKDKSLYAVLDKRKIVSSSKKHLDKTFFLFMKHRFPSSLRKSCIFAKKQCEI